MREKPEIYYCKCKRFSLNSFFKISWKKDMTKRLISPFYPNFSFLSTLKTSRNLWFSDIFREYRYGTLSYNDLSLEHFFFKGFYENIKAINWSDNVTVVSKLNKILMDGFIHAKWPFIWNGTSRLSGKLNLKTTLKFGRNGCFEYLFEAVHPRTGTFLPGEI